MKKLIVILAAICVSFSFYSCKKKEKFRYEEILEFRSTLSGEDTTQMLKLCDDAMLELKNRQFDKVLSNMYEYNDSTKEVKPLSPETAKSYRNTFETFPVLDYHRQYYSFLVEGCNDVKYTVIFATAEQTGTGEPAKTAFMFNPVKKDGQWYLCVKTEKDKVDNLLK